MNATFVDFLSETPATVKCQKCGSTEGVKTVQKVLKGGKHKRTFQMKLCKKCRSNHSH